MQAFTRNALAAYLPAIQATVERYFQLWSSVEEIGWLDEMKRLSIEVICTTVIGMQPGEEMDRLRRDYGALTAGFATLPINVPGTRYRKALQARLNAQPAVATSQRLCAGCGSFRRSLDWAR